MRLSKWAKFKPDTALIKEGDHGDSFFILAGGYVRVTRGKKVLSVLSAGDCFGEMSYLAQKKEASHRSATVTTTSDCIVMKIRAEDLRAASLSCRRPLRRAFPQHPRRPPRARQQAAFGDVVNGV
jgi:CRP-like cAMP-binding protein